MAFHKGFGLIEVLFAAVVLAFLILGLNLLQKGNREGILRVRARDAANTIAQDVIDSISALSPSIVKYEKRKCDKNDQNKKDLCVSRTFSGLAGDVDVDYDIEVEVKDAAKDPSVDEKEKTKFTEEQTGTGTDKLIVEHKYARQVNVTVSWNFKKSTQSINVSSVIR